MDLRETNKSCYSDIYTEIKCMGCGKFGTAYLVQHKFNKKLYIAKKISLGGLTEKEIESAFTEVFLYLILGEFVKESFAS